MDTHISGRGELCRSELAVEGCFKMDIECQGIAIKG